MAVDVFGVKMIHPTNTHPDRARPWFLGAGDWNDRRYNGTGDWNDCPFENQVINFGRLDDPENNILGPRKGRLPVLALPGSEYPVDNITETVIIVSDTNQSRLRKEDIWVQ